MMKSEHQFISEQANKTFQVVAKTFASGGKEENAIMQVKEVLYTVLKYSKQCTITEILHKFQDFTNRIERM